MPDVTPQDQERARAIVPGPCECIPEVKSGELTVVGFGCVPCQIAAALAEQRERDAQYLEGAADHPLEDCQVLMGVGEEARWEPSCELHLAAAAIRRAE